MPINNLSSQQKKIWQFVEEKGYITSHQAEILLNVKQRRARIILGEMVDADVLERQWAYKSTVYVMKNRNNTIKDIQRFVTVPCTYFFLYESD